jgi:hypothetical protein
VGRAEACAGSEAGDGAALAGASRFIIRDYRHCVELDQASDQDDRADNGFHKSVSFGVGSVQSDGSHIHI